MSSEKQYMAADLRGPQNVWIPTGRPIPNPECEIVALNLTASGVSQVFDMNGTGAFGGSRWQKKFLRMIPESTGHIWYMWSSATGTVDNSKTGGQSGVAALLPSLTYTDELPAGRYLIIQPQGTGIVRVWVTNRENV